jgi:hypothetical protein
VLTFEKNEIKKSHATVKREQLVLKITLEGRLTWNDISWDEPRARL